MWVKAISDPLISSDMFLLVIEVFMLFWAEPCTHLPHASLANLGRRCHLFDFLEGWTVTQLVSSLGWYNWLFHSTELEQRPLPGPLCVDISSPFLWNGGGQSCITPPCLLWAFFCYRDPLISHRGHYNYSALLTTIYCYYSVSKWNG